jgi:hypothetical protein
VAAINSSTNVTVGIQSRIVNENMFLKMFLEEIVLKKWLLSVRNASTDAFERNAIKDAYTTAYELHLTQCR